MHETALEILVLLLVGSVVGATARWFRLPYTLALVVAGAALGFLDHETVHSIGLTGDLLFSFLLPALLFEASFHLNARDFLRNAPAILLLAVPGVLIAVAATGAVLYVAIGATGRDFGVGAALLFAAMISATDPVSVLALFRTLGVERRLYLVVEGESLLNDGVAVVVFVIVAAAFGVHVGHGAVQGSLDTFADISVFAIRTFVWMAGGGIVVGGLVGMLGTAFMRNVDDHLVEITATTIVAYGSFLLAEQIGCSGVLSTVTAGMVIGSFGATWGMSTRTRLAVEDFWEYAAFAMNTIVFLLVGLQLKIGPLLSDIVPILLAFAATLVGRVAAVGFAIPASRPAHEPIPPAWAPLLVWGGLRGSLSMVLVLGLPVGMPARDLLIHMVFGVVAASLLVQGLTIGRLVDRLGLAGTNHARAHAAEPVRARLVAIARAMHELRSLEIEGIVSANSAARVRAWYESRSREANETLAAVIDEQDELRAQEIIDVVLRLTDVEREAIRSAEKHELVGPLGAAETLAGLDQRSATLRHALHSGDLSEVVDALLGVEERGAPLATTPPEVSDPPSPPEVV